MHELYDDLVVQENPQSNARTTLPCRADHRVAPKCGRRPFAGSWWTPHAHRTRDTFADTNSSNKEPVCDVTCHPRISCSRQTAIHANSRLVTKSTAKGSGKAGIWPLCSTFRTWKINFRSAIATGFEQIYSNCAMNKRNCARYDCERFGNIIHTIRYREWRLRDFVFEDRQ